MGLERGDMDGRVANLSSYMIEKTNWIESGFVKILVQAGMHKEKGKIVRDPDIPLSGSIRRFVSPAAVGNLDLIVSDRGDCLLGDAKENCFRSRSNRRIVWKAVDVFIVLKARRA